MRVEVFMSERADLADIRVATERTADATEAIHRFLVRFVAYSALAGLVAAFYTWVQLTTAA